MYTLPSFAAPLQYMTRIDLCPQSMIVLPVQYSVQVKISTQLIMYSNLNSSSERSQLWIGLGELNIAIR